MSESFKTAEDELNFILGNDNDGPLFDIDASLVHDHDDGDNDLDLAASLKLIPPPPLPPPTATAIATSTTASSSRDDDEADDSWAAVGGSVTTITMADDDNGDGMESYAATDGDPNDVISRMVALSPTFAFDDAQVANGNQRGQGGDSSSSSNGNAFNDSLMMSDFLTRFEENANDASSTDIINDGNGLLDGAFGDSFNAAASGSGGSGLGSAFSDSLNAAVITSLNGGNNDALSRVLGDSIVMDPTQARDSFAPTLQGDHGGDGDDPLANFANCHPVELEDFGDFNFDDMIAPQSLMMNGTSDNNDYYEPTPPSSSSLRLNPQDHSFHLSLHNNLPIHHEQLLQKQDVMTQEVPLLQQEQSSNILPPPYSFAVSAASKKNVIAHKGVTKTTIDGRPITTTTCHNNFPPIIHPAPKSSMPNNTRPMRKRRIAEKLPDHRAFQQFGKRQQQRPKGGSTPTTTSSSSSPSSSSSSRKGSPPSRIKQVRPVDPIKARLARGKRRRLRARSQAIELVGGGDVSEIERRAVADSDLNNDNDYDDAAAANNRNSDDRNRTTTTRRSVLLAEFSRNFDVEMFVDATFERVYDVMVEANERAEEAAENRGSSAVPFSSKAGRCCNGPHPMEATSNSTVSNQAVKSPNNDKNTSRSPKPIPSTTVSKAKSPSSSSSASAVVTPPTRDKATLKTLPSGKDPESRKLRRLMRNRLSAQASRDRRKKAIEDAQRSTAMKEVEIKRLEKTLEEEKQRMLLLERAVGYARDYLGRERYAKVAGKVSCSSSRAPVGGGSQGESGRVAVSNAIQSN